MGHALGAKDESLGIMKPVSKRITSCMGAHGLYASYLTLASW